MMQTQKFTLGLIALVMGIGFCSAAVSTSTPPVGGWDTKPKETPKKPAEPKETPKAVPTVTYPAGLQAAADKFNTSLERDKTELDKAKGILATKIKALRDAAEPKLVALLKTETIRLAKMDRLKDAKTCKTLLANYEPGSIDWSKVPSSRVQADYKRLLTREAAVNRGEKRKIDGKKIRLERNAKNNAKPVIQKFDALIHTATNSGDLDSALKWKAEKIRFLSTLPSPDIRDPSLVLFLKFDKANVTAKTVKDLSTQKQTATVVGKVSFVQDPAVGGCLQFSGGHLMIPFSREFCFADGEDFSLFLRIRPTQAVKQLTVIAEFGHDTLKHYGVGINPKNCYFGAGAMHSTAKAGAQWATLAYIQKGSKRFLFVNGTQVAVGKSKLATSKKGLSVGSGPEYEPFFGRIREVRLYRRALSKQEMAALTK